jgi:hypothetical protein
VRERCSNIAKYPISSLERTRAALVQHVAQRSARHELHNECKAAVANTSDRVEGDDVRMPKLCDRPRLTTEARYRLVIVREFWTDDLDRDFTTELAIARAIHDSSSPAAKLSEYLVFALEIGCYDLFFRITKHQPALLSRGLMQIPDDGKWRPGTGTLARVKDEGDLTHLDPIPLSQDDRCGRPTLSIQRPTVDRDGVCRRQILEAPMGRDSGYTPRSRSVRDHWLLVCHLRMRSAYGRLPELHVAVRRAFGAAKRNARAVGSFGAHEPDLLADIASRSDHESPGQELECAVRGTPETQRLAVDFLAKLFLISRSWFRCV